MPPQPTRPRLARCPASSPLLYHHHYPCGVPLGLPALDSPSLSPGHSQRCATGFLPWHLRQTLCHFCRGSVREGAFLQPVASLKICTEPAGTGRALGSPTIDGTSEQDISRALL